MVRKHTVPKEAKVEGKIQTARFTAGWLGPAIRLQVDGCVSLRVNPKAPNVSLIIPPLVQAERTLSGPRSCVLHPGF